MKRSFVLATASIFSLLLATSPAHADSFIAPTIGVSFGGDSGSTLVDASQNSSKISYGVAGGWMFNGIFGVEEDFAYAPNFFGDGGNIASTKVVTAMTNVIIGVPVGGQHGAGIRPYGSIGLGLVHRTIDSSLVAGDFSTNDFGYDLGAGVMGYFANHIGVRAGVQYFRNFEKTGANVIGLSAGQFNFFRGQIGVLFRF